MYEILEKKTLSENVKLMRIHAPLVAEKAKAGQFVMLRIDEKGERIPLTIADYDRKKGTVTIIFMEVGKTTKQLGTMEAGDKILNFVGPLGQPSEIEKFGTVVMVGGGVGIAPLYPIVRELKKAGNYVISILGARNKSLLMLEEEIERFSDEIHICTDDGSKGVKGFVSDVLQKLIDAGKKIDVVWAVGPVIMMKVVSDLTRKYGIRTVVSLNPIMVDGTGMCGSCRVSVGGETKFACVDGPEFDGHLVDFDNLMLRNQRFVEEEKHACKLLERRGI
ncbi:MAG: sulfide/dihydroorotate dehydrogenase-like FAD/NAD-binding protein [Thermoplasmata archaeon]|nr:MAG: sulfide/dihydroorotate dehydrogenase-like FAD/NAD-binding protein [Thermoplasmata archaeon]RLF33609.1 MAG: sulfide/dihydroorotate dehydrogenase-like FAD/NAD-binding protein [Thermoplasmata archaeon]RLF53075.1 MAG: sulfide/dihydroorotate dehydrogenase-like FAD/NAD-binding protein [Thermoplasmata archaeon]